MLNCALVAFLSWLLLPCLIMVDLVIKMLLSRNVDHC